MHMIGLAVVLALGLTLAPLTAGAQQAGKVYRIGALREGPDPVPGLFVDAMRGLGWVEGQNLKIERRDADRREQLPALAAELVQLKVDLILTVGTPATHAAKEATKTIPIVFSISADPLEMGLVASFARPGGNLTGFTVGLYDEKLLEILKEALPGASRVAYPSAEWVSSGERLARLNVAARVLGVEIRRIVVQGPRDFDTFFAAAKREGVGAVLVPDVASFVPHLEQIGVAAAKSHLPTIGFRRQFAESGGMLSYGPVFLQAVPRTAAQVNRSSRVPSPLISPSSKRPGSSS